MKLRRLWIISLRMLGACALVLACTGGDAWAQVTWKLAPGRTNIQFKVKHFVLMNVEGRFKNYQGTVVTSDLKDFSDAEVHASIPVRSVYTGNSDRDSHLLQKVFFYEEKYPEIHFRSKQVRKLGEDKYLMQGALTIRGVSRPIELEVTRTGFKAYDDGTVRSNFRAIGKLNRYDFGLKWNDLTETGGMVVDEMVQIVLDVGLVKQAEDSQPMDPIPATIASASALQ